MTEQHAPQQLSLLPPADVPVRFRIDEATRQRGMRHIAEIRAQLAARQAARSGIAAPAITPDRRAA